MGDGDGPRLYNCADNGLVGGAGPAAAAPLLCNDTADGDPLAIEALQFIDCNDEIWCQGK